MSDMDVNGTELIDGLPTEKDAEQAAIFFAATEKEFKKRINSLSKKELKRILYATLVHPLHDEHDTIISSKKEEELVNMHIAGCNAKSVMFSFVAEQQKEKLNGKKETN